MISYNPKEWLRIIFNFHKGDTFRKLLFSMLVLAVYAWIICYVEIHFLDLAHNANVKNVTILHTLLGFAISMLLVFRTNTAYERWWEGRKQWGTLVNNSRSLSMKLNSFLPREDKNNRRLFQQLIARYAIELHSHLQAEETKWKLDDQPHPEIPLFDQSMHVPNQVSSLLFEKIYVLVQQRVINPEIFRLINNEITSVVEICGTCERIKNTPIPYSYSAFLKKFIFIYVFTLPIGNVFTLGYIVIPVSLFIFYVLASLELIAEEIEDPFGQDSNDLPIQRMVETIQRDSLHLLR